MENQELFYPEIGVQIGRYSLKRGIRIEICSDRDSYFDWAEICFTPEFQEAIETGRRESASIYLGYNEIMEEVFTGFVSQPYNHGSGMDKILLKDSMIFLEDIIITETFMDATPQEIIEYCLKLAGITEYKLTDQPYQPKKVLPISSKNVIAVLSEINSIWGLKNKFFFLGGIFYWGRVPEQDKIYHFEFGVNILSLSKMFGCWRIETISTPFIRHSQKIQVTHPKLNGIYVVKKIIFSTTAEGYIRTTIWF